MKYTLGTEGQVCPFPLVEAKQAMEQIELGDELIINSSSRYRSGSVRPRRSGSARVAESGLPAALGAGHHDRAGHLPPRR